MTPPTVLVTESACQKGQAVFLAAADIDFRGVAEEEDLLAAEVRSCAHATRHLINRERLELLKPAAMLINTARGALIDEAALYDALAAGRLAGAGLDVFEHEPYRPAAADKDLRTLDNVLLTPHIGSNTVEANRRMAESVVKSVRGFLGGTFDALPRVDVR